MAILIPDDRELNEFNGSIGERQLYENFRKLSDDYIIFHSVSWMKKSKSVRFGESDYIIFHKTRGILCLEVKHGSINSENGRIYQTNRKTNESFQIDPMQQANRSKYYFIDKLRPIFKEYNRIYPIHSIVWFTGISKIKVSGTLPHEYKINGNTFFSEDIINLSDTLEKSYKFFNMEKMKSNKIFLNKVRDMILPDFEAIPSMSNIVNQNEYIFNRMTKQQSYLLDYLDEQKVAAIQGGAGTGKTVLAIEKASRLSEKENVLFLCFNSLLLENLKNKYDKKLPNVTFTNLYSLTAKALKKVVTKDDILYFLENFDRFPNVWDFKSIVIDEGQDFSNEQINLLKEASYLSEGSFYVFYDKNQLVQQWDELEWLQSMECRLVLSYNCRNTQNIATTSLNPLGIEEIKMRFNVEGEMPLYHRTSDLDELIEWLESRIKYFLAEGISLNQIVILTTKTIEKSKLRQVNNIGKYSISESIEEETILFSTARKFKGLEADVILLVDIDSEDFKEEEGRRVFYVAASRAKSLLELIPTLSKDEESNLFNHISSGKTKRNIALIRDLNVKPI